MQKEERVIRAVQSERILQTVSINAGAIGMVVNKAKTQLFNINYAMKSYIEVDGERIMSGDKLKIVGFTLGTRPNLNEHILTIKQKWGARSWILRHLKRTGIPTNQLFRIYCVLIRPVLKFAAVAFHTRTK